MSIEGESARRVAAFFDLDGTLLPDPSLERRFLRGLRKSGVIPFTNYLQWSAEALRLLPQGIAAVMHANKYYLQGVRTDRVFQHFENVLFFEEGIERVAWHTQSGQEIVLVTGTIEPLARLVATALECELEARGLECRAVVCATRIEELQGCWTGRLLGEAMYGEAKFRAVERLARERRVDLAMSHAYGNAPLDRRMLSAVGHAHAVNPSKEMAALANLCDWNIWHWFLEKEVLRRGVLRTKIQPIESRI